MAHKEGGPPGWQPSVRTIINSTASDTGIINDCRQFTVCVDCNVKGLVNVITHGIRPGSDHSEIIYEGISDWKPATIHVRATLGHSIGIVAIPSG